jgi:7-keto-8-aminopelargonate synthetase-like enzyme
MEKLEATLRQNNLVRIIERFGAEHSETHLKDLVIDEVGAGREIVVLGRRVINFGSDSFLGLDRDPRVHEAIRRGLKRWGTHNGSSRAFASVRANIEAERKLADWLGVESVLIHPSVMLANLGAIPGLCGRQDAIVLDEQAHNSMQEAAKIARANGTKVAVFAHDDPESLERTLDGLRPYRCGLVCIDGVYSMSGKIPPMVELNEVARAWDAVLYIDDAHGTGVLGEQGRGTVLDALGSYDNTFVVGSLSKAFSCAGGFIGCPEPFHRLLKIRSSP